MQGQFVPTCKNEICEDQNKWTCSGLNSEPYSLECRNAYHKPLHHAAVNILDGLYLLSTLSRLGISFPNGNYFIWPTYMITVPQIQPQICYNFGLHCTPPGPSQHQRPIQILRLLSESNTRSTAKWSQTRIEHVCNSIGHLTAGLLERLENSLFHCRQCCNNGRLARFLNMNILR